MPPQYLQPGYTTHATGVLAHVCMVDYHIEIEMIICFLDHLSLFVCLFLAGGGGFFKKFVQGCSK